jgi:thiol-disulfide isomerase/thioredoxin
MSDTPPSSSRVWWYLAIGFAVLWMLYLAFLAPGRPGFLEESAMSEPATFDWPLVDLDEKPVSFAKFKGKTIFLNIWATWCGPCVREMPSIARLANNPKLWGKNIEFVCVSVDDSTQEVRAFLEGTDWAMNFLRADNLPSVFATDGIPATFLIAGDGRIAAREVGATDWNQPRVVAFLEKLVSSPAQPR